MRQSSLRPVHPVDYNPLNPVQVTAVTLPGMQGQLTYTYYPANAPTGADRVHTVTAPQGGVLTYVYDGEYAEEESWNGSAAGAPSASLQRDVDGHGRVQWQKINWTDEISFGYDDAGRMDSAGAMSRSFDPDHGLLEGTLLGNVADSYQRDHLGQVQEYSASIGVNLALDIDYQRDAAGRIKKRTESIQGGLPTETYYKYDPAGRLWRVCPDDACTTIQSEYLYDANSNRTGGFTPSGAITATYNDQDRLLSYNGTTYTYSANGELETKTDSSGTTNYVYDALGSLRHVAKPNGDSIDYVIDGANRRVAKKVNSNVVQAFLYENQLRPAAEIDASGTVISRFIYADKVNVPEYMVKGGYTYRIITDHLGSPRRVIDVSTGAVAQSMTYDEWGNVLSDSSPGFQPFGFAGGIYDSDTGLTRFGARDYDPWAGRWTAKDPIGFEGGDPLLYEYASDDPVNRTDPTGTVALFQYRIASTEFLYQLHPGHHAFPILVGEKVVMLFCAHVQVISIALDAQGRRISGTDTTVARVPIEILCRAAQWKSF